MKYSKLELPFLSGEVIGENLDEMLEEIEKIVKKFRDYEEKSVNKIFYDNDRRKA